MKQDELNNIIEKGDVYTVLDYAEDFKDRIWSTWLEHQPDSFETRLRLSIQEMESIQARMPSLEINSAYHLGRMEGFTEAFEKLFRSEQSMRTAKRELPIPNPKAMQIMQTLYENGSMRHGELAAAIGSSDSSLTNIMKRVLLSGTVASTRSGRNTHYHLTETGQEYFRKEKAEADTLNTLKDAIRITVTEVIQKTIAKTIADQEHKRGSGALPDAKETEQLRITEQIVPYIDNDKGEPLVINKIIVFDTGSGAQKHVFFSKDTLNTETRDRMPSYLVKVAG